MSNGGAAKNRCGTVVVRFFVVAFWGVTTAAYGQAVEWTGMVNVNVDGTTLQKTTGCDGCDDAGARSQDEINSPGGYVEFTVGEANTFWMGGLSNGNGSPSYTGIDYAIRFNGAGGADVLEHGNYKGGDTAYAAGDIFRIAVAYGRVQISRNASVIYTSRTAPTYPLVLDIAFGTVGASLYDAILSHDIVGDPPPPPPDLTISNITWTDLVHVTPGDRVLEKTDGCGGCDDAGAVSVQTIDSGDGYVEFTVGEINTFWVAGLGHDDTDTSYADIDFGLRLNGAGTADVLENGIYKGGDTLYTVGDVFRISVVHGLVYYRHNGEVVYVSQVTPTYPLLFDTALGSMGARIFNANLVPLSTTLREDLPPNDYDGGFFETDGSQSDNRLKSNLNLGFLPPTKGPFQFPVETDSFDTTHAHYGTQAARITDPADCSGPAIQPSTDCVRYVGYSYWRRMNNHVESDTIHILLGLEPRRGGTGPTLFGYNKNNGIVANMGPLFDVNDPFRLEDAEMWYFSRNDATEFYAFGVATSQLVRFHIALANNHVDVAATHDSMEVVMDLEKCPRSATGDLVHCPANAQYFDHPHSSDNDLVHVATVVDPQRVYPENKYRGCVVYDERKPAGAEFRYFAPENGRSEDMDECALDKSGRWLVLHEGDPDDELVIDLTTNEIKPALRGNKGAHAHADLGYGYEVGADDEYANYPNATTLFTLPANADQLRQHVVHYDQYSLPWDQTGAANHVSHTNALDIPAEEQYACGSNATQGTHRDEIVCFSLNADLRTPPEVLVVAPVMTTLSADTGPYTLNQESNYARRPKGNLDVTGEYFIWTTNMYNTQGRVDAFIVKVPKAKLLLPH